MTDKEIENEIRKWIEKQPEIFRVGMLMSETSIEDMVRDAKIGIDKGHSLDFQLKLMDLVLKPHYEKIESENHDF